MSRDLPFNRLSHYTEFKGKRILEIGGNSDCGTAIPFLSAGAESVVVSGLDDVATKSNGSGLAQIEIVQADARRLSHEFDMESFDMVYGISVIEHIHELPLALSEIKKVLKPGGLVYLQGNPIWSGPIGHHIWVTPYHNQSDGLYTFMAYPGSESSNPKNPIPDWGHLLMSPVEMGDYLISLEIPIRDAIRIVDCIYYDKGLSRASLGEITSSFSNSGLITLLCNTDENSNFPSRLPVGEKNIAFGSESAALQELRSRFKDTFNFRVSGIEYVMQKSEEVRDKLTQSKQ